MHHLPGKARDLRPLFVIGTRPEAIKLAPVIRECEGRGIDYWCYFTGQHEEEVCWLAHYFEIAKGTFAAQFHGSPVQQLARYSQGIERELQISGCDVVVGQGDTFSASAAAQVAFYCKKPFVHVEAGLTTNDLHSPWPEEYNRRLIAVGASLHCTPTERALRHLVLRGARATSIIVTGNTAIDALLWTVAQEEAECGDTIQDLRDDCKEDRGLVLITAHRRENQGGGILRICQAVSELANRLPNVGFFWLAHQSPTVRAEMAQHPSWPANVMVPGAVRYPKMCKLLKSCTLVLTDSGGLQEEAPAFKKPVIVLRESTERQELIEGGGGILVGTDHDRIVSETSRLLSDGFYYAQHQVEKNPFGDGHAAPRIVDAMVARFDHCTSS